MHDNPFEMCFVCCGYRQLAPHCVRQSVCCVEDGTRTRRVQSMIIPKLVEADDKQRAMQQEAKKRQVSQSMKNKNHSEFDTKKAKVLEVCLPSNPKLKHHKTGVEQYQDYEHYYNETTEENQYEDLAPFNKQHKEPRNEIHGDGLSESERVHSHYENVHRVAIEVPLRHRSERENITTLEEPRPPSDCNPRADWHGQGARPKDSRPSNMVGRFALRAPQESSQRLAREIAASNGSHLDYNAHSVNSMEPLLQASSSHGFDMFTTTSSDGQRWPLPRFT